MTAAEMLASSGAYGTMMLAMIPTGLAAFGIHHIWKHQGKLGVETPPAV